MNLHLQAPIPRIFDGSASDGMAWYTSSDGKARCSDSADQDVFTWLSHILWWHIVCMWLDC